jgi:sporulation protein YlmC with PRC-barrel domain
MPRLPVVAISFLSSTISAPTAHAYTLGPSLTERSSGQVLMVHHEAGDNIPPVQMLTTIATDDWPITTWYKQSVYDLGGNKIGEIADVLVNHDGKNTAALIGVGGFIGVGEKYVAVPFDAIRFWKKDNSWVAIMNTTKEALKNAPGYKYDRSAQRWIAERAPNSVGQQPR